MYFPDEEWWSNFHMTLRKYSPCVFPCVLLSLSPFSPMQAISPLQHPLSVSPPNHLSALPTFVDVASSLHVVVNFVPSVFRLISGVLEWCASYQAISYQGMRYTSAMLALPAHTNKECFNNLPMRWMWKTLEKCSFRHLITRCVRCLGMSQGVNVWCVWYMFGMVVVENICLFCIYGMCCVYVVCVCVWHLFAMCGVCMGC